MKQYWLNIEKFLKPYQVGLFILACLGPLLVTFFIVLMPGMFSGHDFNAHMLRLISLKNEMNHNQFPTVFDYWTQQGIGYSWQLFYAPFTNIYLFISTYFFGGLSSISQMKITMLLINIVNFICAFYAGKRQYNSNYTGLFCAGLLFSSTYYLSLVYTRFALSELACVGFIILLIRGLDSLCSDKKDRYLIPISASVIVLCSIPVTIATTIFAVIYSIFNYKKLYTKYNIIFLLKSIIIISLISCIYLIPLISNLKGEYIYMSTKSVFTYEKFYNFGATVFNILTGMDRLPLSLGIFTNILLIVLLFSKRYQDKKEILIILSLLLCSTVLFPWWIIPESIKYFNVMQFPWRLLSIAICCVALWLSKWILKGNFIVCTTFIVLSLLSNPYNLGLPLIYRETSYNENLLYKDYVNNNMLKNVNTLFWEPIDYKNSPFQANWHGQYYTINSVKFIEGFPYYSVKVSQATLVSLPVLYYNFVTIKANDIAQKTIYNSDGSIGVNLDKGEYIIKIGYDNTAIKYGIYLFILGIVLLVLSILKYKYRARKSLILRS